MDEEQELRELQRLIDDQRERQGIAMNLPSIPEYILKQDGFIRVYFELRRLRDDQTRRRNVVDFP